MLTLIITGMSSERPLSTQTSRCVTTHSTIVLLENGYDTYCLNLTNTRIFKFGIQNSTLSNPAVPLLTYR